MQSPGTSSRSQPEHRAYSAADELWAHLAGMFGADAIERKFGDTRPPQWDMALQYLKPHELQRGVRRLMASGAKFPPTLPEFMRLARSVESDEDDRRPPAVPALPAPPVDEIAQGAVSRVGRYVCANFARYSHPADLAPDPLAMRNPNWRPHPVSQELREPLRRAARTWVEEMHLQPKATPAEREDIWRMLMLGAEAEVDAIRARHKLPAPVAHVSRSKSHIAHRMANATEPTEDAA